MGIAPATANHRNEATPMSTKDDTPGAMELPDPHPTPGRIQVHHPVGSGSPHPAPGQIPHREPRYVYYVCGHIRVHHPVGPGNPQPYTAPFDHVIRTKQPVTDEGELDKLRAQLRHELQAELTRAAGEGHRLAGEPMLRNVSHLHTILVDSDDADGAPARVVE